MGTQIMEWDDFILALHEGLDGIDYKTAKRVHKALYPEARVTAKGKRVQVTFPEKMPTS